MKLIGNNEVVDNNYKTVNPSCKEFLSCSVSLPLLLIAPIVSTTEQTRSMNWGNSHTKLETWLASPKTDTRSNPFKEYECGSKHAFLLSLCSTNIY